MFRNHSLIDNQKNAKMDSNINKEDLGLGERCDYPNYWN